MSSKEIRPKWWQLYLTLPLLVTLFAIDARLKISSRGHQAVQIGIVLLLCALVRLWLKANAMALSELDRRGQPGSVRVLQVHTARLPESDNKRLISLPDSEVKGMLHNIFEMDYIDAEFLPIDEVSEKIKE